MTSYLWMLDFEYFIIHTWMNIGDIQSVALCTWRMQTGLPEYEPFFHSVIASLLLLDFGMLNLI